MSRNARVPVPLITLDQDSTLVVVLELSARSWLVGARVPGIGRMSRYALAPSAEALAAWLDTAKARAGTAGRMVVRVVLAYEAGRDGFWLARYLEARGVEVYVIQPSSVLVDRRARRAKTDALDVEMLMRTLLAWLRGEPGVCSMVPIPDVAEEDGRRPVRERQGLIGERLALEAELAQSRDRAEDANRAKSVFLSNISHEIRTPLNAVLGYAQLLEEHEGLDAGARVQVHAIHQAGKRLLGLINDVLDLSKIEAGALQLRPEPLELHSELAELHALMKARATQQGLRFELQRHFDAPCPALLDRGKFGQVLLNLLGNAIKFTPAGGTVRLIARVEPTPSASRRLDLRVEDDGPGIAADERVQLFQPFRQGRSGERKGGTGLGLALSRKLVEAMGGELGMDSAPGQGTQAHLHLPLPMPEAGWSGFSRAPREAALQWRLAAGRRCRVLVAEDDDDSRQLLVELLQRLGCEVAAGADGQLALELAWQHDYDIVLSDMRMPVLDGIGLRAALAAEPRSRDWPVVAVTASSLTMNREDFLRLGFAEHIGKPYTFDEVLGVLRRLAGAIFERRQPAPADAHPPADLAPATQADASAAWPHEAEADTTDTTDATDTAARRPPAAALRQGLELAREGRAGELRGWLREQKDLPPAMQQAIEQALARYDLQAAEQLLQTLIEE